MADHTNKEVVISMRTALKAGRNLPLKVYADNGWIIVDESVTSSFTKWDDENGVIYYFRLADPMSSKHLRNNPEVISVCAIKYEFIQAMEVVPFAVELLDDVFDSIEGSTNGVTTFSNEFREKIKHVFHAWLKPRSEMYPELVNAIVGDNRAASEAYDYYSGRPWPAPEKENADVERYNADLSKLREFQKNKSAAEENNG